jgi:hypothetical protein
MEAPIVAVCRLAFGSCRGGGGETSGWADVRAGSGGTCGLKAGVSSVRCLFHNCVSPSKLIGYKSHYDVHVEGHLSGFELSTHSSGRRRFLRNFYVFHFSHSALPWKIIAPQETEPELSMTRVWNHLAGVSLAGQYRLEQYLGSDESAAWYLTMSRSGERAAIKLIPEDATAAAAQLDAWRATRLLSHSNLLPMFDCGRAPTDGGAVLFAVFEYPDDNLASALERGQLDESDARDTLAACLGALRYIHGRGMVHGAVDGQHVVAVGERVKLASDSLRPVSSGGVLPEDDIRALHRLLGFPYQSAAPLPPVAAPLPPVAAPLPPVAAPKPLPVPETSGQPEPRSIPHWMYGAAVGLVIAIGLAFVLKPSGHPKPVAPRAAPSAAVPAPSSPLPIAAAEREPAPSPAEQGRTVWRVVAYTYHRYRDAEKKVRSVNSRWPGLHAAVFTPKGKDRPPYFVALGGRMTHAEALNLRRVARAKGLPRDTFVRNYSD